jgi:hypothetical protein
MSGHQLSEIGHGVRARATLVHSIADLADELAHGLGVLRVRCRLDGRDRDVDR